MDTDGGRRIPGGSGQHRPNGTLFVQFLGGTGSMLTWWGDAGSNVQTNAASIVGRGAGFSINPGRDEVITLRPDSGRSRRGPNFAPNMAYIGWGVLRHQPCVSGDEKKRKAAWSAAAHLGGKDLSLWTAAYPSGFQPYRNSHFHTKVGSSRL